LKSKRDQESKKEGGLSVLCGSLFKKTKQNKKKKKEKRVEDEKREFFFSSLNSSLSLSLSLPPLLFSLFLSLQE
jgi:hypothetical protein